MKIEGNFRVFKHVNAGRVNYTNSTGGITCKLSESKKVKGLFKEEN